MDAALRIVIDMNEFVWNRLIGDLKDLPPEEVNWRPLPQANNISTIVRHLRIEAEWQVNSIERGELMDNDQSLVDKVGFDYEENLKKLHELCPRFIAALRNLDENTLQKQSRLVYEELATKHGVSVPPHFLSFHHPLHLCSHWGQIRTIRTLYRKTRGEPIPPEFYPDNPSYPPSDSAKR